MNSVSSGDQDWSECISGLSGVWEGISRSRVKRETTRWTRFQMKFRLSGSNCFGSVSGSGTSYWKSKRIPFDITGSFNLETKKIVLRKEHKGEFTNVVEYFGFFDIPEAQIAGDYLNGIFNLSRVTGLCSYSPLNRDTSLSLCDTYSAQDYYENPSKITKYVDSLKGEWSGISMGKANSVTKWIDISINFDVCSNNSNAKEHIITLNGSGTSIWKGREIPFCIDGEFSLSDSTIKMRKTHIRFP